MEIGDSAKMAIAPLFSPLAAAAAALTAAAALGRKTVILRKPIQTIQTIQTRYQVVPRMEMS